ncbi:MAG: lysostaphin resistance A-like protein [Planctomycetota bacterium]
MDEPAPPPTLAAAPPAAKPPLWPYLLAPFIAFAASAFAGGIAVTVVATFSDPGLWKDDAEKNLGRWYEENQTGFPVIAALLLTAQVTILATTLIFAMLARDPSVRRLGFVRWKGSGWTVAWAVLGTLGVQFLIDLVAEPLIDEPSDSLKLLARMFLEPQGLAAVGVGFLMSVLPGVCEEALYRGYMQRGLLRRWSPVAAIGLTSLFFAAMHMDVQHSLGVLPLGAWLGFVAWRTGSVWPAVLCHFANNLAAFVFLRLQGDLEILETPDEPAFYVVGAVLVACGLMSAFRLMRTKPDES